MSTTRGYTGAGADVVRPAAAVSGRYSWTQGTIYDALDALTVETPSGCLVWRNWREGSYPWIGYRGSMYQASRLAWVLHNQADIPAGAFVLHSCDESRCIRGEHLHLGDAQLNADHRMCRSRFGKHVRLDWQKVHYIRSRQGVAVKDLANELGVCKNTIRGVLKGRSWISECI